MLILRRLQDNRIGHAIGRVEPVCRRNLTGAGQMNDQAIGDIAFGHARELCLGPVDVDVERRLRATIAGCAHRPRPEHAGSARSSTFAYAKSAGRLLPRICRSIGAGEPKLRIWLTMSAGGNENVTPGNATRQFFAQLRARIQRWRDGLRSARSGCRHPTRRWCRYCYRSVLMPMIDSAHVVDDRAGLSRRNRCADTSSLPERSCRGLLDAHTDRRTHMQQNLAAVDLGEEVAPEKRDQREGEHHEPRKPATTNHDDARSQAVRVVPLIAVAMRSKRVSKPR